MIIHICDLCGKKVGTKEIVTIQFKGDCKLNFLDICPDCVDEILGKAKAIRGRETQINRKKLKETPERLTIREWRNLDPWETCGDLKETCNRGTCRDCIVPKRYAKLAAIEDEQEAAESKGASEWAE